MHVMYIMYVMYLIVYVYVRVGVGLGLHGILKKSEPLVGDPCDKIGVRPLWISLKRLGLVVHEPITHGYLSPTVIPESRMPPFQWTSENWSSL